MPKTIKQFQGEYRWLSNFYEAPTKFEGLMFSSNEAAFQAAKTLDIDRRRTMLQMPPNEAKRTGRGLLLRPDWEEIKNQVMHDICLSKFVENIDLRLKLVKTGDAILIEGNTWGDKYWGVDLETGVGQNHLGLILMDIRKFFLP